MRIKTYVVATLIAAAGSMPAAAQVKHIQTKDAGIATGVWVGGTDSRYYEPLTDNIFRFSPLLMAREDLPRMHGTNERVGVETLANASGFYYRLLQGLNTSAN